MNKIDEENPPMRSALDLLLDMGHERGLKQGVDLLRNMVLRQLRARFGEPGADHQRRLQTADTEELQALGERLATAASLADVFLD
jgi:hypothetical protein